MAEREQAATPKWSLDELLKFEQDRLARVAVDVENSMRAIRAMREEWTLPASSPDLSALWGLAEIWLGRSDASAGTVAATAYTQCAQELIGWLLRACIPRPEGQ